LGVPNSEIKWNVKAATPRRRSLNLHKLPKGEPDKQVLNRI